METFHCQNPEPRQAHIVKLVSRLITYEIAVDDEKKEDDTTRKTFPIHHIGSQIVQTLLHFSKPIKIVQSLLDMEMGQLRDLFCDPCGSHIMDAFASSEFVGEKSREKLFHKLQVSGNCGKKHFTALNKELLIYFRQLWNNSNNNYICHIYLNDNNKNIPIKNNIVSIA